jgi:hypothetical protein
MIVDDQTAERILSEMEKRFGPVPGQRMLGILAIKMLVEVLSELGWTILAPTAVPDVKRGDLS